MQYSNVYLIGPMGAGKSSVGKKLALLLKMNYIDIDEAIEQTTGVSIGWIFEREQESGFRLREAHMIEILTQRNNMVLSTGGGAVLLPSNRRCLRQTGVVVYLKATLSSQLARSLYFKNKRPLLAGEDPEQKLRALFETRQPLYEEIAHYSIETDHKSIHTIARLIAKKIKNHPPLPCL